MSDNVYAECTKIGSRRWCVLVVHNGTSDPPVYVRGTARTADRKAQRLLARELERRRWQHYTFTVTPEEIA